MTVILPASASLKFIGESKHLGKKLNVVATNGVFMRLLSNASDISILLIFAIRMSR